jgi:hypothetical protein
MEEVFGQLEWWAIGGDVVVKHTFRKQIGKQPVWLHYPKGY